MQLVEEYGGRRGKWTLISEAMGRGRDSVLGRYRTIREREERERIEREEREAAAAVAALAGGGK